MEWMTLKHCSNSKCDMHKFTVSSKFCSSCGGETVDNNICKYCKATIAANANFCTECGKPNK